MGSEIQLPPCDYYCPTCGKREWNQMYMPDIDPLQWWCLKCGMASKEAKCVRKEPDNG